MKLARTAMMATGLFLAQQAQAASFLVLSDGPGDTPRSVQTRGAPASPPAAPDRSIETSALRQANPSPGAGPRGPVAAAPAGAGPRDGTAWPPTLSRSMVAYGEPRPVVPETAAPEAAAPQNRSPFGLPAVFRAGLAGDAFTTAPAPARTAQERPAAVPAAEDAPQTPAVAGRREPARPTTPDAATDAPPTVPATPAPTMRLE